MLDDRPRPFDDGMCFTGRLAGGFVGDVRRRWSSYRDDFVQGLSGKVFASVLFLYMACLANAIAFGGLTSVVTDGQIGIVEMIVATAAGGIAFALFGGQPLTILGGTGPVVIFTGLLYGVCRHLEIDFLGTYGWVGIWTGAILIVLALIDASALMRWFTRFTDEIFAALIALIFIVEAVGALAAPFLTEAPEAQALLGLLLGLATFVLAMRFKNFAKTRFLWRGIRDLVADFGPALAIGFATGAALVFDGIALPAPAVPAEFETTTGRAWMVDLGAVPGWVILAALVPALMAAILLFLDQNITARLVDAPEHRLRKGRAFHLDLLVVGLIVLASSCFGLPWIVAATVHSLNHVKSLARTEVRAGREVIVGVRENRVSGLAIHALLAGSILFLPLVQLVPMAVLFGLFLYMGVAILQGNQFFERLTLMVTDPALYPECHYVRRVRHAKIHAFTAIQAAALGLLWVLKSSPIGILFPLLIGALVPLRLWLTRLFTPRELQALDADESTDVGFEGVIKLRRKDATARAR